MNLRLAIRALLITGSVMLLWGFFMETTVSTGDYFEEERIVNLDLQATQQKLLVTGGILFLAGVLLFGFRMLKQTPTEAAAEQAADLGRRQAIRARLNSVGKALSSARFLSAVRVVFAALVGAVLGYFIWDAIIWRTLAPVTLSVNGLLEFWMNVSIPMTLGGGAVGAWVTATHPPMWVVFRRLMYVAFGFVSAVFGFSTGYVLKMRYELQKDWSPKDDGYRGFVFDVISAEHLFVGALVAFLCAAALTFYVRRRAATELDYH